MSYLSWPISTVIDKLKQLQLDRYSSSFQNNDISGAVLPLLKESHLKDLGMTIVGHRLQFKRFIKMLELGLDPFSTNSNSHSSLNSSQPKASTNSPAQSKASTNSPTQPKTSATSPLQQKSSASSNYQNKSSAQPKKEKKPAVPPPSAFEYEDDDEDYAPPPKKSPAKKSFAAPNKQLNTSLRRNQNLPKAPPPPDDANDDRVECAYCHRRFASDRIGKHEEVCARMSTKKKKVFDASKQRLRGTEAAAYAKKAAAYEPQRPKPSKYKAEHQKLVESLRAARKYQAYEKAREEGRAVGPPPELPKYEIEDDDRVQCPHCGRKFGAEAAQRHISVCERMNGGGGGRMRTSPTKRFGRR